MDGRRLLLDARDERGRLMLYQLRPGLIVSNATGHLVARFSEPFTDSIDARIEQDGSVTLFHEWFDVTGYDTSVRLDWTEWTQRQRANISSTHILVSSRIVAMGVRTAALALALVGAKLVSYTERERFMRELDHHRAANSTGA